MPNPLQCWIARFRFAFRGIGRAILSESSFLVHLPMALLTCAAATVLQVSQTEWCLLLLCIATVLAAECFNTAIEALARAVTKDHDPQIERALDVAAGAVLIMSLGAAAVGIIVLLPHVLDRIF